MNRKYLIIAGASVVTLVFVISSVASALSFHLTGTTPKNGTKAVGPADVLHFHFNQPLDSSATGSFSISPNVDGKTTIDGKELTFKPGGIYAPSTTYTATLEKPKNKNGVASGSIKITFTTADSGGEFSTL